MKFVTPDICDYRGFKITLDFKPDPFWPKGAYHASFEPELRYHPFGRSKKKVLAHAKREIDDYLANQPG